VITGSITAVQGTAAFGVYAATSGERIDTHSTEVTGTTPLGRVDTPDEIATALSVLVSDEASY
jgi:hypothetical protein